MGFLSSMLKDIPDTRTEAEKTAWREEAEARSKAFMEEQARLHLEHFMSCIRSRGTVAYLSRQMAGALRNGNEFGGSVYHATVIFEGPEGPEADWRSLCGKEPRIQWRSIDRDDPDVNCPRCLKKLADRAAA